MSDPGTPSTTPSRHISDLPLDQQQLIRTARASVERDFAGTFGPETIERFIVDSLDRLMATARVTAFLPLLTEKFTRERLRALARLEKHDPTAAPTVLFLCVHNAGRSQMAAGWLRHLAGERVGVFSGGSEPGSEVNPVAIEAMAEVGVDIRAEFPKPWTEEVVRAADVVVTMGCGDACPLYPGKRYEDWELDDPAGQDLEAVRPIRDEIRARVEALMATLDIAVTSAPGS
jgi:arsenate reductase (thioredoxin)